MKAGTGCSRKTQCCVNCIYMKTRPSVQSIRWPGTAPDNSSTFRNVIQCPPSKIHYSIDFIIAFPWTMSSWWLRRYFCHYTGVSVWQSHSNLVFMAFKVFVPPQPLLPKYSQAWSGKYKVQTIPASQVGGGGGGLVWLKYISAVAAGRGNISNFPSLQSKSLPSLLPPPPTATTAAGTSRNIEQQLQFFFYTFRTITSWVVSSLKYSPRALL